MNLLNDIQSDLVNESASLANTLRKAKILANRIGLSEFQEWVDSELSGYRDRESVPEYRRVRQPNYCTVTNGRFLISDAFLPTTQLPDNVRDIVEICVFSDGVGELEAKASTTPLYKQWTPELLMIARRSTEWTEGGVIVDAYQNISTHAILGVLDQIRNRLLDFVLGLQEYNITPENMKNQTEVKETARNVFHISIHGNQNSIASGENVSQTNKTVTKGDVDSLLNFLRELNLDDGDLREVEEAISVEPNANDGLLGPRVREWLGGMMEKIASGALTVGGNAGTIILTQAIKDYYGINPQG